MTSFEGIGYVPHWIVPCHSMSTVGPMANSYENGRPRLLIIYLRPRLKALTCRGEWGVCVCASFWLQLHIRQLQVFITGWIFGM